MLTEPTNAVLAERVKQLQEDLIDFRQSTRLDMKDVESRVELTRKVADNVNFMVVHVKESVDKMDKMMNNFINVVGEQNTNINKAFAIQNTKIDEFVNSDQRMNHKKQFVISVLQVVSGIVLALLGFWASGKV